MDEVDAAELRAGRGKSRATAKALSQQAAEMTGRVDFFQLETDAAHTRGVSTSMIPKSLPSRLDPRDQCVKPRPCIRSSRTQDVRAMP